MRPEDVSARPQQLGTSWKLGLRDRTCRHVGLVAARVYHSLTAALPRPAGVYHNYRDVGFLHSRSLSSYFCERPTWYQMDRTGCTIHTASRMPMACSRRVCKDDVQARARPAPSEAPARPTRARPKPPTLRGHSSLPLWARRNAPPRPRPHSHALANLPQKARPRPTAKRAAIPHPARCNATEDPLSARALATAPLDPTG